MKTHYCVEVVIRTVKIDGKTGQEFTDWTCAKPDVHWIPLNYDFERAEAVQHGLKQLLMQLDALQDARLGA